MIDRVELILLNQTEQMRKFHSDDSVRLKHEFQATHEIVEIRNVCKDIVADEQIRAHICSYELLRRFATKELDQGRDAFQLRHARHILGRFNPQNGDPHASKILK